MQQHVEEHVEGVCVVAGLRLEDAGKPGGGEGGGLDLDKHLRHRQPVAQLRRGRSLAEIQGDQRKNYNM